ncbi:MAG TPA: superoxide dismutase family protein [Candidatus Polarisedimenticolia bacterium]|nr:superoxide dismutase family protein [Candidatus Polarisedimenticolia bacterium]
MRRANVKMIRCLIGVGAAVVLIAGVVHAAGEKGKATGKGQEKKAVAVIASKSDSHLTGKATFREANGKVTLKIEIAGAEPGTHAVHLHENGDCSAPDGSSAGGHWNPTHEDHGKWGTAPFHRADIGNIEVGADGKGTRTLTTDLWTIGGAPESDVIGKSIIVHAKADDFTTQPTGNAGGRIGCGVVELARKK